MSDADLLAVRKAALAKALDSALDVVVQTRDVVRDASMRFTPGERQTLAVALEGMSRVCMSFARECERPAVPVKEQVGA